MQIEELTLRCVRNQNVPVQFFCFQVPFKCGLVCGKFVMISSPIDIVPDFRVPRDFTISFYLRFPYKVEIIRVTSTV